MTNSLADHVQMFDGLWYPRAVLEDIAPNLFKYRQDHEALEESFDFPSRFPRPGSALGLFVHCVSYMLLSMFLWCVFVFGIQALFLDQFITAIIAVGGIFAVAISGVYCMIGASSAYHGPFVLQLFTNGKVYFVFLNKTNRYERTVWFGSFKYKAFKKYFQIRRGTTAFAGAPWIGAYPVSFFTSPRKCHLFRWSGRGGGLAVGLTPETAVLWEEFMLLQQSKTGVRG